MIIFLVLVGFVTGLIIGHFIGRVFSAARKWRAAHKRFLCDVCKMPRARANSTPLALDLDYGDALLPINLRVCKVCVPPNSGGAVG